MCMMSLKYRSSSDPEVRAFLSALAPHFESITAVSAQFVGNALYGLRGCSSEHLEVRSILRVLEPQIAKCTEKLNAQADRQMLCTG